VRRLLAGVVLCAAASASAQAPQYDLKPRRIAEGHWVIEGAVDDFSRANGCNIINTAFIATGEGVVVINTGPSRRYGVAQRSAIASTVNEPVQRVLSLNLHPDYFFGHQAWADVPTQALAGTVAGMRAEGGAYADNLYRLCGDWMQGTEATPAREAVAPQTLALGTRRLELRRLRGHTGDDLVVLDRAAGVLYAGGLVFAERVPTTPHADFDAWLAALDELQRWHAQGEWRVLVPAHGPVHEGLRGVEQTRDWLRWLSTHLRESAQRGVDLSELLREPVPARFAAWAAQPAELHRTLAQWYPRFEQAALRASPAPR
jgi:quinoprotein relay system zinc metallohydrolase 1